MDKLRFEFVVKAADDPKTNNFNRQNCMEQLQKPKLNQKVKTTLQKRHDKRQVWISMTEEIKNVYIDEVIDEDRNMQFNGYLLEEITSETQQGSPTPRTSEEALTRILENFTRQKYGTSEHHNIRKLSIKFVIEKFTGKTSNVSQWMNIFEAECNRLGIEADSEKIEVLRLFLEESCLDWYSSMPLKHTINSEWSTWRNNFCETYANKGWTPIRYAFSFKYIQGSLIEYALKKEKLLLEINKSIDKPTLIDLIATGLPNFVSDMIDRHKLKETTDLFNNNRGLEHLVNKNNSTKKIVTDL